MASVLAIGCMRSAGDLQNAGVLAAAGNKITIEQARLIGVIRDGCHL
jgi:hypothetical protein